MKLDNINKNHPFKVPDNYFEELSTNILERKSELRKERSTVWSPNAKLALAGTFVVIVTVTTVLNLNIGNPDNFERYLAGVPTDDIVAYLATSDLSELDLMEMIDEETILDFGIEDDILQDLDINDESLDDLYLDYGLTDELTEI